MSNLTLPHSLPGIVIRWSPTFPGCFDPYPWHPPIGESVVVAKPLLVPRRPGRLVSSMPYLQCSMMHSLLPQLTVSLLYSGLMIQSLMLSSISKLIVLEILCTLSRQETVTLLAFFHHICILQCFPLVGCVTVLLP